MNFNMPQSGFYTVFIAMITMCCFGSVPIFLKFFTAYLDAWTLNGIRYLIGAMIWFPFIFILRKEVPAGHNPWKDALIPFFVNICGQTAWGLSPYYNEASVLGFGARSSFLFAILFGFILLPEERKLAKVKSFWFGSFLCLAGVLALSLKGGDTIGSIVSEMNWKGVALILIASIFYGAYGVVVQKKMKQYPARLSFGIISLYTALALLVELFLFGDYFMLYSLELPIWGLIIASSFIGISIAHVFFYQFLDRVGALTVSGIMQVTPLLTALLAFFILNEHLNYFQIFGAFVLISGGFLLIKAKKQVS